MIKTDTVKEILDNLNDNETVIILYNKKKITYNLIIGSNSFFIIWENLSEKTLQKLKKDINCIITNDFAIPDSYINETTTGYKIELQNKTFVITKNELKTLFKKLNETIKDNK